MSPTRQLIDELKAGAELTPEGASAMSWREKVRQIPLKMSSANPGRYIVASSARQLLLQRGQLRPEADTALRGILLELAVVLEIDLDAERVKRSSGAAAAPPQHYWQRED